MNTAPFVEFQNVTRQWNGKGGVADVSLTVERGAFVSVLGPSGCGKSTLLRLLAGLDRPQSGAVLINSEVVNAVPAAKRGLSMVFQSYALFPHLSVGENIVFGMKVRGVPRRERELKADEAIEMMALRGLERRKPSELSGGQRQRVALARAVVAGHPLCLMDEPLSNLDAKLRHAVRRDIKSLQRRLALTIVYVTHDQTEAMSLSDRIVLMNGGQVEQIATPQELYDRPKTPFAAEFIGDPPMAIIDGPALGLAAGVSVGVRPGYIELTEAEQADLVADIDEIEFLGPETRIFLSHPAARGLAVSIKGRGMRPLGTKLGIKIPKEHQVLFNTGLRACEKDVQQDRGDGIANRAPVIVERPTSSNHCQS